MQNFIIRITQENLQILQDERIGCFILPDDISAKFADEFVSLARKRDKLVLCCGADAVDFYKTHGADGFIIDTAKENEPQKLVERIKQANPRAVIGVISRNRRHEAMLVSEAEPDFVIFKIWCDGMEHNLELLSWYGEFFLIQYAAQIEEDVDWRKIKSDFIIISDEKYRQLQEKAK